MTARLIQAAREPRNIAKICATQRESGEIEELRVQKVRWPRIHQRAEHHLPSAGVPRLPAVEDLLDLLALQSVLAAAEVAGNDRVVHRAGKLLAVRLGHEGERPADEKVAILVHELRRHGGQPSPVKEVHEEGLEDVVAVMAEDDRRTAFFPRDAVEVAATPARA